MTLEEYRQQKEWSYSHLAKMVGCSHATVASRWCKGEMIPKPKHMEQIIKLTQGAVSPNDFYRND